MELVAVEAFHLYQLSAEWPLNEATNGFCRGAIGSMQPFDEPVVVPVKRSPVAECLRDANSGPLPRRISSRELCLAGR